MNDTTPPPDADDELRRRLAVLGEYDRRRANEFLYATDKAARSQAAADMAHRDDLARDVAREWRERRAVLTAGRPIPAVVQLAAALDRLSAAYTDRPE